MAFSSRFITDNHRALILTVAVFLLSSEIVLSAPVTEMEIDSTPHFRHQRSYSEDQLRISIGATKKYFKEIRKLYGASENLKMRDSCLKVKKLLAPIKSAKTFTLAAQTFRATLLQLGVFVDKLKDATIKTDNMFNAKKRHFLYELIHHHIRLVVTEYEDVLRKKNKEFGEVKVPKIKTKCLPESMDKTMAFSVDTDFFRKLQKFLNQSWKVLKNKRKQRKGKGEKKNKNGTKVSKS